MILESGSGQCHNRARSAESGTYVGDVRESCALRLSSYGIYVRERERWARSMRTCALALRVRERNTYILMTSEKIYSNLSSIADEAGTRLSHGGHLAQHGDGAIPRARARFKHLGACVSSGGESVRSEACNPVAWAPSNGRVRSCQRLLSHPQMWR